MINIANTTVGVVGAGTMGQGIAQVCATSGFKVVLYDVSPDLVAKAKERIATALQTLVEKGKITKESADTAQDNVSSIALLPDLKADVLIEAVVEDLGVKQALFRQLEEANGDQAIYLTNTSSIPITQIAAHLKYKERFAGLHFFNPAPLMKLVEIVQGSFTSRETVEFAQLFASALKKQAVIAQDSPGFIVNRVARLYYVEALKLMEEGVTDHQSIDNLLKNAGFKMGPFELMDLIGIDVNLSVTKSIYNGFQQEPRFRPSRIQQEKVDAGFLGRKTGKGFYDYNK
jgi:3-hydroxybutyryl-CoA dehydrogenase